VTNPIKKFQKSETWTLVSIWSNTSSALLQIMQFHWEWPIASPSAPSQWSTALPCHPDLLLGRTLAAAVGDGQTRRLPLSVQPLPESVRQRPLAIERGSSPLQVPKVAAPHRDPCTPASSPLWPPPCQLLPAYKRPPLLDGKTHPPPSPS
jgi:hypothetical protein